MAYGIKKLQISCVIEDDKIGTDFLEESITAFEDIVSPPPPQCYVQPPTYPVLYATPPTQVQSVDIVAFNKIWTMRTDYFKY